MRVESKGRLKGEKFQHSRDECRCLSGTSMKRGGAEGLHQGTTGCERDSRDGKEWIGGCPTGIEERIR